MPSLLCFTQNNEEKQFKTQLGHVKYWRNAQWIFHDVINF